MGLYITLARKNDSKDSCSTTLQDEKVYEFELNWNVSHRHMQRALTLILQHWPEMLLLCKTNCRLQEAMTVS